MKNALYILPRVNNNEEGIINSWYYGLPKGTSRAEATLNSEKIKAVTLAVIALATLV